MAVLTENLPGISIPGLAMDDYVVMRVSLHKELLRPSELRFTMRRKQLLRSEEDVYFEVAEQLMGAQVKMELTTERRDEGMDLCRETLAFSGIVFSAQLLRERIGQAAYIAVSAYSPDYLLIDNPHCCSYEQSTLSDIIGEAVSPYRGNLVCEFDSSLTDAIPYVVQYNETTYQFISRLAQRYGQFLFYEQGKLHFGKLPNRTAKELYPDVDVLGFQYMLNLEHSRFQHAQHNYLTYENTAEDGISHARDEVHNLAELAFDRTQSIYKKETLQNYHSAIPEESPFSQLEVSSSVQAWGDKSRYLTCRLRTNRADILMGDRIVIQEHTDMDDGLSMNRRPPVEHEPLVVIGVDYSATADGHFENEVTAIPADVPYAPYLNCDLYPVCESQRARVVENIDPEQLGRIRVQFLWQELVCPDRYSPWIRITQPHGGDDKGFYFIPEVGEEVMVAFENGNAEKPYVVGTLYHGQQHPGNQWPDGGNNVKAVRTRNGHTVEIHDEGTGGYIRIYDYRKENYVLTFSTDEKLIRLESTGNIELEANHDIVIHAHNDILMTADNNMDVMVGMNRTSNINENDSETVGKNQTVKIGERQEVTIGSTQKIEIAENQEVGIDGNQYVDVKEDVTHTSKNYKNDVTEKMHMYSKNHEQKSDEKMDIDGGKEMNVTAIQVKIN